MQLVFIVDVSFHNLPSGIYLAFSTLLVLQVASSFISLLLSQAHGGLIRFIACFVYVA